MFFFFHGISCKRHVQFIENVNMVKGDQESEDCICECVQAKTNLSTDDSIKGNV